MATTNLSTAIERAEEVRYLASAIYAENDVDWTTALRQADRQLDDLLAYAAQWDAQVLPIGNTQAERDISPIGEMPAQAEVISRVSHGTQAPPAEPVYVPSALEPHEQRAMDKALFERARGIVPQVVGRFAFVPSRTVGGTVYRVTSDSCTCEAFTHGRLCWHRCLIALECELAA